MNTKVFYVTETNVVEAIQIMKLLLRKSHIIHLIAQTPSLTHLHPLQGASKETIYGSFIKAPFSGFKARDFCLSFFLSFFQQDGQIPCSLVPHRFRFKVDGIQLKQSSFCIMFQTIKLFNNCDITWIPQNG